MSSVEDHTSLELILGHLTEHYRSNARGRLTALVGGGVPPRFLLGRSAEGCVWRFDADLADDVVRSVAKLAGREPGRVPGQTPSRPERLEMIARLLGADPGADAWQCESIEVDGEIRAELWIFTLGVDSAREDAHVSARSSER